MRCDGAGQLWTVICNGQREAIRRQAAQEEASVVDEKSPTLEEIFVAYAKRDLVA
jgi:hypothetical protein